MEKRKISIVYALAAAVLIIALAGCEIAGSSSRMPKSDSKGLESDHALMGLGYEVKNGEMVVVNPEEKTEQPMAAGVTLSDGTSVSVVGKVLRPDGSEVMLGEGDSIWEDGTIMKAGEMMEEGDTGKDEETGSQVTAQKYTGKVLAGTVSKYIEFSQTDYQKALTEGKIILLYFYANWCPVCKAEEKVTLRVFDALDDPRVVGFRVNYKDADTDDGEVALAQEFGITYQHSRVILREGEVVLKALDSWDAERYRAEFAKV